MLPLSICIIAKNEQTYIGKCLKSLSSLNCEIILVDTGSTDKTIEIASQYTSQIYSYPWDNNFSNARNFSVSKAKYSWILYVDCDEFLDNRNLSELTSTISNLIKEQAYYSLGTFQLNNYNVSTDSQTVDTLSRMFHKDYFIFTGSVHEQLTPTSNHPVSYFSTGLIFKHMGYRNTETLLKKANRNINLLLPQLESDPQNPYLLYQLGQSYYSIKDWTRALTYFEDAITYDINPSLSWVITLVESYGYCLLNLKFLDQALQLVNIYDSFCHHADFVFLMGLIYMNCGHFEDAITEFTLATTISSHSVNGVNSFLAHYNCGVIYECTGHPDSAIYHYSQCNDYTPAKDALKRLHSL